jgi:hypothetical protein
MNQKNVKAMKREQRRIWREYLEQFSEYLRPKPRWCPWFLWTWMQKQVLRMDKVDPISQARGKM